MNDCNAETRMVVQFVCEIFRCRRKFASDIDVEIVREVIAFDSNAEAKVPVKTGRFVCHKGHFTLHGKPPNSLQQDVELEIAYRLVFDGIDIGLIVPRSIECHQEIKSDTREWKTKVFFESTGEIILPGDRAFNDQSSLADRQLSNSSGRSPSARAKSRTGVYPWGLWTSAVLRLRALFGR